MPWAMWASPAAGPGGQPMPLDNPTSQEGCRPVSEFLGEGGTLPAQPVRLFGCSEDPCLRLLRVQCLDQVGLLCKLCELLTTSGIDISSADIRTKGPSLDNRFVLRASRVSQMAAANDWCRELEQFVGRTTQKEPPNPQDLLTMKRLSVNPDLLSVADFRELQDHDGPPTEYRYHLELRGINQAGLLCYASLVFFRCGFNITKARIVTNDGRITDNFELATVNAEAQHVLRTYFDVPYLKNRPELQKPLPFQATRSDNDLQELIKRWDKEHSKEKQCSSSWEDDDCAACPAPDHSQQEFPSDLLDCEDTTREGPAELGALEEDVFDIADGTAFGPPVARSPDGTADISGELDASLGHSNKRSISFANGDVFVGDCVEFEGGEKRHGHGAYSYFPGTHASYKQYKGQWVEDKKHGYGVLFFRSGGVYVGQWEKNRKHGLGVMLEPRGKHDASSMPSYHYEGQWFEDEPHGLAVEETEDSLYFGSIYQGSRCGRGLQMSLTKMGIAGCEVLQGTSWRPLLQALEVEMNRLQMEVDEADIRPPEAASLKYHFSANQTDTRPSIGSLCFGDAENGEGASAGLTPGAGIGDMGGARARGKAGAENTPVQRHMHHADDEKSSSGGTDTATKGSGHRSPMMSPQFLGTGRADERTPTLKAGSAYFCGQNGATNAGTIQGGNSNPSTLAASSVEGVNKGSEPMLVGRHSSEPMPVARHEESDANASVTERQLGGPGHSLNDFENLNTANQRPEALSGAGPVIGSGHAVSFGQRQLSAGSSSLPEHEQNAMMNALTMPAGLLPRPVVNAEKNAGRQSQRQQRRPLLSPLLWSEDELAAFMSCLGLSSEVQHSVQRRKLKGAGCFAELSNTELRRDLCFASAVERLVARQALKRLLEADRWENTIRGRRGGDVLHDTALSAFIIPLSELTIVTQISQGGYGQVYRGVLHPSIARGPLVANKKHVVAVKEMKGERRVRLYELLKEACIMASLSHPNICTFIGVCADASVRNKNYIVSELMDCSLLDLIHQPYKLHWHGELSLLLVIGLSQDISAGISYLHSKDLVHADLKSSNILIDYSSTRRLIPRICDFGHVAVRTHPAPHHRCGTPHWAAPEVLRNEALGPAADIFSFGVVLWEMLSQKMPHSGLSFGQVVAAVGWAGWIPDMDLLPEVPKQLRSLLLRCLSFTPFERPRSRDVQKELRNIPRHAKVKGLHMLHRFFTSLRPWCR